MNEEEIRSTLEQIKAQVKAKPENKDKTDRTELINFLTVIITMRVRKKLKKTGLSKNYSQKQIFRYLSKYKKVRSNANGKWEAATMLKYISEICSVLGI